MTPEAARRAHYSRADLEAALRRCGVAEGDVLFSHVSMGMLGYPEGGATEEAMFETVLGAVMAVIGPSGTWLVPTYTYSFCRSQPFDPASTPSTVGPFTERFRKVPGAARSHEPIFSVAGVGPQAAALLADPPRECFGEGCLYERLVAAGAKTCNIGVGFRTVTFVHYTEQRLGVPYRYLKPFSGDLVVGGKTERQTWLYNVGVLQDVTAPDLHALERTAAARGCIKTEPVGMGAVTVFTCADLDRLAAEALRADPWALARGPRIDLVAAEKARLGDPEPAALPMPAAGMEATARALAPLLAHALTRAEAVSRERLLAGLPAVTRAYRTGSRAGRGVVPEAWRARSASLETLSGERLLSLENHPFVVPYYSAKFSGEVSREELLARLHAGAEPGVTPYVSLRGAQTWGLACAPELKARLIEARYRVSIDTVGVYGEATAASVLAPGREPETVALLARSDHGGLSNDGLSGAVVGAELMRRLLARPPGRRGVMLVLASGGFGFDAFFRERPELAGSLSGVAILDSLGIAEPLALQVPRREPNVFEKAAARAVAACGEPACVALGDGPWLSGGDLPSLPAELGRVGFHRAARPLDSRAPYAGFRTSRETPDFVSGAALDRSLTLLLGWLDSLGC